MKPNLKFLKTAYFPNFLKNGAKLMDALCSFVADLQTDRDATVSRFLEDPGSEDFIWSIIKLLGFQNEKIAGNAAFVIGTLADTNAGSDRLVSLIGKSSETGNKILVDLLRLLNLSDDEIVLNGVGALGSLVDSEPGRFWICNASHFDKLLDRICSLLRHKNVWIGSNSALLLARLTILDKGLSQMLVHSCAKETCVNLILSLGSDAAGRGMNAAFALGRIVDVAGGQELIAAQEEDLNDIMIKTLSKMVEDRDVGTAKNALYALSCLAGQKQGSAIVARNKTIEKISKHLTEVLVNDIADNELRWFCAMTLRSLACQQKTCLELKRLHYVYNSCKTALRMPNLPDDIKEEVIDVLEYLRPLPQMQPARLQLTGPLNIKAEWDEVKLRGPFRPNYTLVMSSNDSTDYKEVYHGKDLSYVVLDLNAYTFYSFKVRVATDHEEGPQSESTSIRTEEWLPGQVRNLHMVGRTPTQVKVAWSDPQESNGIIRHFNIYLDDNPNRVGKTEENYYILQNLNQNGVSEKSAYTVRVAAVTGRGEGLKLSLEISTAEIGDCRPSKPIVTVLGRSEASVTWNAPPNAPGKIMRYELLANNEVVYSGMDLFANLSRLQADTEYTFQVLLISNEGRYYSQVAKKSTAKDEFISFTGPRAASSKGFRNATKSAFRRRVSSNVAAEVQTGNDDKQEEGDGGNEGDRGDEGDVDEKGADEQEKEEPAVEQMDIAKQFARSKTMATIRRRKPVTSQQNSRRSLRALRSLPPIATFSKKKPTVRGNNSDNKNNNNSSSQVAKLQTEPPPSEIEPPTSGKFRERSSTTSSRTSDSNYPVKEDAGPATARNARNRSLSMVMSKLRQPSDNNSNGTQQMSHVAGEPSHKTVALQQSMHVGCSVVTLNLPDDVPNALDAATVTSNSNNRLPWGYYHPKPELISADFNKTIGVRRSNTTLHQGGQSTVAPTAGLGHRGVSMFMADLAAVAARHNSELNNNNSSSNNNNSKAGTNRNAAQVKPRLMTFRRNSRQQQQQSLIMKAGLATPGAANGTAAAGAVTRRYTTMVDSYSQQFI